jgi:hypothetical protein
LPNEEKFLRVEPKKFDFYPKTIEVLIIEYKFEIFLKQFNFSVYSQVFETTLLQTRKLQWSENKISINLEYFDK